jgi:hypothetical protein
MIITGTFKDRTWTRKFLTITAMDNRHSKDIHILTPRWCAINVVPLRSSKR